MLYSYTAGNRRREIVEIIRENYREERWINNNYTSETVHLCGLDFVERIPAE